MDVVKVGEEGEMHNARERDGMQHKIHNESKAVILQNTVKTFLPGFGNGWLKYYTKVQFLGGQRNILRVILKTKQ